LPEDPPPENVTEPLEKGGKKEEEGDRKEYRAGNCNDCNRQFCLDYNLPICKGAGMDDVFTTCFRTSCLDHELRLPRGLYDIWADLDAIERDSRKDEAVVFIFIFATAGLLIWAAIKPWVGKWVEVRLAVGRYTKCLC